MFCLLKPGLPTCLFSTSSLPFLCWIFPHKLPWLQICSAWLPYWQIFVFLKPSLCRPGSFSATPPSSDAETPLIWSKNLCFFSHGRNIICPKKIHLKKFEPLGAHTVAPILIDLQGEGRHQQGRLHQAELRRPNLPGNHAELVGRILYVLGFFKMLICPGVIARL